MGAQESLFSWPPCCLLSFYPPPLPSLPSILVAGILPLLLCQATPVRTVHATEFMHGGEQKWAIKFFRMEHPPEKQTSCLLILNHLPKSTSLLCFKSKIDFKINKVQKIILIFEIILACYSLSVICISKTFTFKSSFKNMQLLLLFMTESIWKSWQYICKTFPVPIIKHMV